MDEMITRDNITQVRIAAERAYRNRDGANTERDIEQQEIETLNQQSRRIEQLVEKITALSDPDASALAQECIQAILDLYGQGLQRILKLVSNTESSAQDAYQALIQDSFISGLLLIHDLHPIPLETRIDQALKKVRPYMDSHGGSVELVSLEQGVAKLRLNGSCDGCPSSAVTLELAIKQALEESCPDLIGLEVEGVVDQPRHDDKFKILNQPDSRPAQQTTPAWTVVDGLTNLRNGSTTTVEIAGTALLVCKINDKLYAYRNHCPACDLPLSSGALEDGLLKCRLGHSYEVQHAGICADDPELHLEPFPLLQENSVVKVAVRQG